MTTLTIPLAYTFRNNHINVARLLLELGADPNLHFSDPGLNNVPLNLVKSCEMIELLLEYDADIDMKTNGKTIISSHIDDYIHYSFYHPEIIDIIKCLLEYGADIFISDDNGNTIINKVLINGGHKLAKLIEEFLDITVDDIDQNLLDDPKYHQIINIITGNRLY